VRPLDPSTGAAEYLLATRGNEPQADVLERRLAGLTAQELRHGLADDAARIAFWLDLYNAAVLRADPVDLTSQVARWRHFRRARVVVAGQRLSLDEIEHGLLRRSRWKLTLGYCGNPLPGRFELAHRVDRLDPRIHFALNCGAASCPPIAAYHRDRLEQQLEMATVSFLRSEVRTDVGATQVPALLLWYIGDLGGPAGLRRLLRRAGIEGWGRPIRFATYDWTPVAGRWLGD
jgi:hypothetical protein